MGFSLSSDKQTARLKLHKTAWTFLSFTVVVSFLVLSFGMWENFFSNKVNISNASSGISWSHPLGTDQLGRDLLARCSIAIRQTVLPLWLASSFAFLLACLCGGIVFIYRDKTFIKILSPVSLVLAYSFLAIPFGVAVFMFSVYRENINLTGILLACLCLVFFKTYLKIRDLITENENLGYWKAHQSLGGSRLARYLNYGILQNFRKPLFSEYLFSLKLAVAAEVTLSYLGFGVPEPKPSIGNMMSANLVNALNGEPAVLLTSITVLVVVMYFPSAVEFLFQNFLARLGKSSRF